MEWQVGFHRELDEAPQEWIEASVPGAVQLDYAKAHGWPPHWVADHFQDYAWMEDVFWTYRARMVPQGSQSAGERLFLVIGGVDYRFRIAVDGVALLEQEGMFTPVEMDVTERVGELTVTIWPVPKSHAQPADRGQADRSCKPAVSYGWDFHARLIPSGIWKETRLEWRPPGRIESVEVFYELADDFSSAEIRVKGFKTLPDAAHRLILALFAPDGESLGSSESGSFQDLILQIQNPTLWWPHTHGNPALYRAEVSLVDAAGTVLDSQEVQVGLRRVRLVMAQGVWKEPGDGFPKTRCNPPMTLEINGREIFAKGTNVVASDIFPGTITAADHATLVDLAKAANFNLLRLWGGAATPTDAFFACCDRQGIMVWVEFPLSCNPYGDDPEYLRVLDQESRSIIRALRPHPCVVLWCGGNELFNSWSRMTDQSLALRLLNRNCYDLDPKRPFLPTSPVMGVGHGAYTFIDPASGNEIWHAYQNAAHTAYTEFGCPGPIDAPRLREIIPAEELLPPRRGTCWETHHGFGAWDMDPATWLQLPAIQRYFPETATLDEIVEHGQILQAEGLRGVYEEIRRQSPAASMALSWCFNEPWPCAANCSLLGWPFVPKKAYTAAAEACRPILASAKIPKFGWKAGEEFTAELWLLNDSFDDVPALAIHAVLHFGSNSVPLEVWIKSSSGAQKNIRGLSFRTILPETDGGFFRLELRAEGHPAYSSEYLLCLLSARSA